MPTAVQPATGGLRFDVLAEIAIGTTARVDLCRTTAPISGQLVAVKRLVSESAADPVVASRFLDEVWMTSALRHTNVVGVVGWGKDEQGPYLAVELVQGVSLARLMKTVFDTREEFPERLVVYAGLCICRGLQAAHELTSERGEALGLVHRDLGVQNVLVGFNGDVKIADFGLAKAKNRMTQTTSSLPTRSMGHLSPEELRGEEIDSRADLYGVGVMLYELLTGRQPFVGKDELDTARLILNAPTPDPIRVRPRIDMALAATVRRCLEKNPDSRFRSARDIGRELEQWLYNHGYREDNPEALGRFVRRNSMRQMRWFERVITGEPAPHAPPRAEGGDGARAPVLEPAASSASASRDTETTSVDANKRPRLPPRRTRSSDAVPAVRKRRDSVAPDVASRAAFDVSSGDDDDEGEDIPTVAMKRGDHPAFRALMESRTDQPTGRRSPQESRPPPANIEARRSNDARPDTTAIAASPLPNAADRRAALARQTIPIDSMMAEASSSDVVEITDDPSTVTPPPKLAPVARPAPPPPRQTSSPPRPPPPQPPPPLPAPIAQAPAREAPPSIKSEMPRSPQVEAARATQTQTETQPLRLTPSVAPSRHGFGPRVAGRATPAPMHDVIESPTTFDPLRTKNVLGEPTTEIPNHALAPDYIQREVERLRDDAAQKNAESRRLRELAELAMRDADRAERSARRAEHAAAVAVEAVRLAASEGIGAATAKLEEALAISEQ